MWWMVDGDRAVMNLVRRLPPGDESGHAAVVADYPDMAKIFHEFTKRASDAAIRDNGGGAVPYDPEATPLEITQPVEYNTELVPFWTVRMALEVAEGEKACVTLDIPEASRTSWRPGTAGADGVAGAWSDGLPSIIEGELVVVATTVALEPGQVWQLDVTRLIDSDETECDPPPSPTGGCLEVICDPSGFYRLKLGLPEWFQDLLD
jgi:hypothetical protein